MMGNTETQGNRFNQPIHEGANVFDVNGEKVGSVNSFNAQGGYLTIQQGWLLTHDIYVPSNNIGRVVASEVYLNLSKDDLKDQRWATPPLSRPESRATGRGLTGTPPAPEQGRVEPLRGQRETEQDRVEPLLGQTETEQGSVEPLQSQTEMEQGRIEPEEGRVEPLRGQVESEEGRVEPLRGQAEPEQRRMEDTFATSGREEDIRLPLREEEFFAEKQAAETKHVRLHKRVIEEQATSSVPVTREEVTIERIPLGEGGLDSDEMAFREQDIDIPLRREEVIGGKRIVAHEAVRIHKELVTEVEEVSGMVRKERWSVEGAEDQIQEMPYRETGEQSTLGTSETV